jgi:hypothetical protein
VDARDERGHDESPPVTAGKLSLRKRIRGGSFAR